MEGHDKNELTQLCVTIEQKNKLWYDIISYYILTSLLHYQNSCNLINYRQFDNILSFHVITRFITKSAR